MKLQQLWFLLMIFLFSPLTSQASKTTIIADAKVFDKNNKTKTLKLKGDVNVIFHQQHLLCDEAVVYENSNTIVAKGNVILQTGQTTLRGERIEFNYDTNTGKLYNGVVTSGQVLIEAEVIEKVGENEYLADDAYYTACTTCPPSWGFTSANVRAEIGGYAYITRPWLHLLQFPVLPLPYLVVPLNSKRQTGFLVPKPFSNPDGGFAIEQPFFWAIDRSHDATFSLVRYEKRGLQGLANYRYVISPTSSGELNTGYLWDRTVSVDSFKNRWFFEYGHHYDLPDNYTQRTSLSVASDRKYAFDFFQQFQHNGDPALENTLSLSKTFENSLLTLETSYYLSQIEPERTFHDDESLHRLPEINFEMNDVKISDDLNLFFSLEAQYLNITKRGSPFEHARTGSECDTFAVDDEGNITSSPVSEDLCYPTSQSSGDFIYGTPQGEDPVNDSSYGDLIRAGQRLDLMPRIHAPFWVGQVLDVDPSLAVRYTQYSLGVANDPDQGYNSFPSRFYSQFGLDVRSDLNRIYQWDKSTRIKHSILPEINLRYIPEVHQSEHNFFGDVEPLRYFRELQPIDDSDADWRGGGRGIQFDHQDRIIGKQFVDFGIANKVIKRNLNLNDPLNGGYSQAFYFKVSQALDLFELRKGSDARAWQSLNTLTRFTYGRISQTLQTAYFPYHSRTQWDSDTRFSLYSGSYIGVGYRKNYNVLNDPPVDDLTRQEFINLKVALNLPYVYFYGQTSYDLNTNRDPNIKNDPFQAWTAKMQITPPGSCWTINMQLIKSLNNPSIQPSLSMEFKFSE